MCGGYASFLAAGIWTNNNYLNKYRTIGSINLLLTDFNPLHIPSNDSIGLFWEEAI